MSDPNDFNGQIIEEFRANGGKVGGMFEGAPMVLVHHKGAKSGTERVNPLMYRDLGDGAIAVFASKGGAPTNPDWYHNLVANPDTFDDTSFHVHVPAGATPKDGPSAGITMTTAIASLLSGRPVKHTVGMTGEVTLQGRVLPIGGLKQKALAAHAAGLTDVIIPERNRADLEDIPEDVKAEMSFHPVMTLDEVLALALEPKPAHALS